MIKPPSVIVLIAAVAALAGCGGRSGSSVAFGRGDSAKFVIDGRSISVTESGTATVHVDGAPAIDHNGPVGCGGRYFETDFVDGVRLDFSWGSQDAALLIGSDLYYLGGAPTRTHGQLSWDTADSDHQIHIVVDCAPPPPTGPLVASATPGACSLLTRAIAQETVHLKLGAPKFVRENPDLSYCEYKSLDQSSHGDRRVSASVAAADQIVQLSSWQQPAIGGLGDQAHGGDASTGLAVRKGKLGLELTVDLGFDASNDANLAAEKSLARRLLARLPG